MLWRDGIEASRVENSHEGVIQAQGMTVAFFVVLKTRKWLTVKIKKCLSFYHHNVMGELDWQGFGFFLLLFYMLLSWRLYGSNKLGEDIIRITSLVITRFLNTIYEINRNEIIFTF